MTHELKAQIWSYAKLGLGVDDIAVLLEVRGPRWRNAIKSIVWSAQHGPK